LATTTTPSEYRSGSLHGQDHIAALPQSQVHVTFYVFIIAGVVAGVGSAVVVLLLIMVVLTGTASIAVVKSCKRKGEYHFRLAALWTVSSSRNIQPSL